VVETDERPLRPQHLSKLVTRDDFARAMKEIFEHGGRLRPQPNAIGSPTQLAAPRVEHELAKTINGHVSLPGSNSGRQLPAPSRYERRGLRMRGRSS
jgi:hypothetical protein